MALKEDLLSAYRAALHAVDGSAAVARALGRRPLPDQPIALLALGKAAAAMSRGALEVLGDQVSRGLVVCPIGYAGGLAADNLRVLESAHPVPDASSVAAGEAVTAFVSGMEPGEHLVVLLSGGTSSLVELPVEGLSLEALSALNGQLLAEGYDIATINAVRKALSRIKGGRLGHWLEGKPATVMAVSDVPGNALHVIGSGPLHPDPEPADLPPELARRVRELTGGRPNPAPGVNDPCLAAVNGHIVADNETALAAAMEWLRQAGYTVKRPGPFLNGEVGVVAERLAGVLTSPTAGDAVMVWGGEPTVHLPEHPGRGGRMHALAVALALALRERDGWAVLAAGTDGADGNAGHAGALIDAATAAGLGKDALAASLRAADTASCLEGVGAVIDTGPTGTNVMDVVLVRGPGSAGD